MLASPSTNGSELLRLGALGLISGVRGNVTGSFGVGTGSIIVNDSADTAAHTFDVSFNGASSAINKDGAHFVTWGGSVTALTLQTGTAQNTVNIGDGGVTAGATYTVQSGGTNDAVNVTNFSSNAQLDIVGGAGVDAVSIATESVEGAMQISNAKGLEAVSIDASGTSSPQVISVSDTSVTGLSTKSITMSSLKSLSITGGSAFDNFSVTPSATVPITVDGGPTTGVASDRLDVNTAQVTGTELSLQTVASGEQGAYSFSNRQPINFSRFGVVTPAFDDLKGTVFNAQDAEPVAGATVTVDTNSNGVADAGEPTTTSAADGTFSFNGLPAGTFPLLITSATFNLETPITVSLAAGVLQAPLGVAVVPAPTPAGPDLAAAVTVTAGKSATSKPRVSVKITNIGAAMTTAAGAKVLLLASADKVVDLQDSLLGTFTAAGLKLKTKGSKTFTLTGNVPTSLVTGHYYVLASVDADNLLAEANESNNVGVSTKQLLLAPPLADLTGKFGAVPKSASKSKILTIPLTLQNIGTVTAGGTIEVDLFASADKNLDDADTEIGSGFPLALHMASGRSQSATFKVSLAAVPSGSRYIIARINAAHAVNESSFKNNVFASATAIAIA